MTGLVIAVAVAVIVGGGLLVVAIGVASGSRGGRANPMDQMPPTDPFGPPVSPVPHQAVPYQGGPGILSEPAAERVRALMSRGQKINAIKLVREETRMGLKEAKDYVEAMAAGRIAAAPWGGAPGRSPLSERVRSFKAAGDPASAVALVRAETGMTQSEAERFVDALD
ncbi:ribosomal protein L7/L12 [Actinomadura scrupuli]|uniref:ribosomal protein L7/L12 n=1 Tax=Actinomadura scrupuli TaxID=559629 RepID=UPI003D987223